MKEGGRRARRAEDKQARRQAILDAALSALNEQPYTSITMAEIAARAGVAKGTPYLYFETREALFLALQCRQLADWFDALDAALRALPEGTPIRVLVGAISGTLDVRTTLTRLLAILHPILEHNVDLESARALKRMLLLRLKTTGTLLERRLPFLPAGHGAAVLLRAYALILGLQQLADPAPVVRQVLDEPGMEPFVIAFGPTFADTLLALFEGYSARVEEHTP